MKRIFVQMVSYRDPECHHTLADLFAKARYPERISVGLCWQYDPAEDAEMLAVPLPRADQVRAVQFHVRDARGAGWARNEAQKLWAGEDYILQLQAHHRFEPGWDETLIALLEGLPTRKAVLTAWLPGYTPPDHKPELQGLLPVATVNRLGDMQDAQIVHLIKLMIPQTNFTQPFLTASWVGNFMFTHAGTLEEVPFDPHVYFWGEELNYSARLWTHGYDIYHLDRPVLYHYWDRKGVKDQDQYRDHAARQNRLSLARNLHVLGFEPAEDAEALTHIERYPLGSARPLSDYFAFIGVDIMRGTIAPHARVGNFTPKREKAGGRPRIFVAIASYRDPETQATVADLLARARYPDRVHVGICHQIHLYEDADCRFTPPPQVTLRQVDCRKSRGANWARAEAMALHAGEEYILQIDSHMRFEPGWDEALIGMLARCPNAQAVISAYLPTYELPDKKDYSPYYVTRIRVRRLGAANDAQLVHLSGYFVRKDAPQGGLAPTPFVIANFMFARAETWKKVPIDPHIYFYGDEISLSARLWTHGVDVFQPDCTVAYHRWVRPEQYAKHPYRRPGNPQAERSRQRVRHLLELERTHDTTALTGLERYGLGDARPLADFWVFAGVDIAAGTVSEIAQKGGWKKR
ncbi:MAG: GlcNAc-transferase family protein [Alphaproteobacteria bacterium]|nr:GlcNAc-transferase family protein [Alphaproteobacteria bacterium]